MAPFWASVLLYPATTQAFRTMVADNRTHLDPNRILCPVLASLYNNGDLPTDSQGAVERRVMKSALKDGTGASLDFAEFQSGGISNYDADHKRDQDFRDRCAPVTARGTRCFARRSVGSTSPDIDRFLNIFEMNGLETVEHGFSTGVRGGNCNSRAENDECNGQYPCESLFQKFYAAHADSRGRLYKANILQIVCHALAEGDRSGEFAHQDGDVDVVGITVAKLPARTWQMKAAMQGWLSAFGRADENGDLYFTVADARSMLMEGRFPDNWQKRRWGCVTAIGGCPRMPDGKRDDSLLAQVNAELPCDESAAWWGGAETTVTGQSCTRDSQCSDDHALCLSRRCTCGKGRNGLQMLYQHGSCTEQRSTRKYFGETCRFTRANNPDSPSVW